MLCAYLHASNSACMVCILISSMLSSLNQSIHYTPTPLPIEVRAIALCNPAVWLGVALRW